jgi:hypothetical protein
MIGAHKPAPQHTRNTDVTRPVPNSTDTEAMTSAPCTNWNRYECGLGMSQTFERSQYFIDQVAHPIFDTVGQRFLRSLVFVFAHSYACLSVWALA